MSKSDSLHQPPEFIRRLLCTAINNKRLIEFQYKERRRVAEPHDYGMIKSVKKLLTYQVEGESESGDLPDWRWAEVDEINRVRMLDKEFAGAREAPSASTSCGIAVTQVFRFQGRTHVNRRPKK